jgi:hypothetical protein
VFISTHKLPAFDASEKNTREFADDAGAETPKSRVQTVESADEEEDDSDIIELMRSCLSRTRKVVLTRRDRRRR